MTTSKVKTRREFFKSAATLGVLGATGLPLRAAAETVMPISANSDDRQYWVSIMGKIARPVLENLSCRELKKKMPIEEQPGAKRSNYTHLEAFGRLLCGIAPWLALGYLTGEELKLQRDFLQLAQTSLDASTDLASPDFMNFSAGNQPLVDTAFLHREFCERRKSCGNRLMRGLKNRLSPR